jgi:predicted ABC-type ATPase
MVDLTLTRIKDRVLKGGHDLPESAVRRRFDRSFRNFFIHYRPLADTWLLFDNPGAMPLEIATKEQAGLRIMNTELYKLLIACYGES